MERRGCELGQQQTHSTHLQCRKRQLPGQHVGVTEGKRSIVQGEAAPVLDGVEQASLPRKAPGSSSALGAFPSPSRTSQRKAGSPRPCVG